MNRTFLTYFLLLLPSLIFAQFYQSGQDPSSIHWKQINTPNFQVIFPAEFEPEANRFANTLEYVYVHVAKTLNHKPKKISVILHSQSSYSNGLVTWAPKRMELFTTPPQDNYSQDWLDQLAVHELRHVVQIDKLDQGITKVCRIIFGEQIVGGISGYLPRWFLEGDAVATETALTNTGRGRSASFEMEMKALTTNQPKLFSYEKAVLGSYKNYVPDYYHMGYPLVAWSRQKYGSDIFDKTLNFVGRNPYPIFPFPTGLKKQTGLNIPKLYKSAFTDLKSQWNLQINALPSHPLKQWNRNSKKGYTNYRFPQFINDSVLLVVKSGINQLKEFILLDESGKESRVHIPGNFYNDKLTFAQEKYVWAEEIPDIRWQNRSFSCIKVGDFKSGKIKMISNKSRYFSPSLSPDGTKIATVEVSLKNEYSLVILEAGSGKQLDKIASPANEFLQVPEWTNDGKSILLLSLGKKGKAIRRYFPDTKTWEELYPPTFRDISSPTDAGAYVLFSANLNGTNDIYAISKNNYSLWQVTNSKLGAFDPKMSTKNQTLLFAEYSSHGYDVVSIKYSPVSWKRITYFTDQSPKLYEKLAKQEGFNLQDSIVPINEYPVKSYSKFVHTFNVHSWAPFYYDYDNLSLDYNLIKPGISLTSQDKLGTCIASAGYAYNQENSFVKAKISYQALFPIIELSSTYGGPTSLYSGPPTITKPAISNNKLDLSARIYLPLNLTRGIYATGITPSVEINYKNNWFYYPDISSYQKGLSFISYYLYTYRYLRTSARDLAPKWGVTLSAKYYYTPFENTQFGRLYYLRSRAYMPGLLPHHSLQITGAIQNNKSLHFVNSTQIVFPRGFSSLLSYLNHNPLLVTNQLKTLSLDYTFPIAYPDFDLGPLFYLKRIRSNLFLDLAKNSYRGYSFDSIKYNASTESLASTGVDMTADFHLFRILFPINAGVRMIYFPNTGEYTTQLLFRIDLGNY